MIYHITDIREEYRKSSIYIWETFKESISIFTRLAFRNIKIDGFIVSEKTKEKEEFCRLPVLEIEEINRKNPIIVIDDRIWKLKQNMIHYHQGEGVKFVKESDLFSQKYQAEEKAYIYGIGEGAEMLYNMLDEEKICGFVTTEKKEIHELHGKPVITKQVLYSIHKPTIIVSALHEVAMESILNELDDVDARSVYILTEFMDRVSREQEIFFPAIDKAIKERRNICLIGNCSLILNKVKRVLELYEIDVNNVIKNPDSDDLFTLEFDKDFVILCTVQNDNIEYYRERLFSLGFSLEKFDFCCLRRKNLGARANDYLISDLLTGVSQRSNKNSDSFYVLGNINAKYKIMVLGGSTSMEELYCVPSWVRLFYNMIDSDYIAIFCCACPGFDIVKELAFLLRDVHTLKPDMVISMSGYNNIKDKSLSTSVIEGIDEKPVILPYMNSQFNLLGHDTNSIIYNTYGSYNSGLKTNENLYDFWVRIQKYMRLVAESEDAIYISFLQPICMLANATIYEKAIFCSEINAKYKLEFQKGDENNDNDVYISLLSLLENEQDAFIDHCHYSKRGNEVIAQKVLGYVAPHLSQVIRKRIKIE